MLPGNDFAQLRRMGNLLDHYTQHRTEALASEQQPESLLAFCWSHLNAPNQHSHQDGGASHHQLPLQSLGTGLMVFMSPMPHFLLQAPPSPATTQPEGPSLVLGSVFSEPPFQPPILA